MEFIVEFEETQKTYPRKDAADTKPDCVGIKRFYYPLTVL
jgi:hypothetical protein